MNKILLIGNVGRDIELTHVGADKTAKATTTIATNERVKGENKTTWHNVVLWGKRAEAFAQYTKKGSKVLIEGKQNHDSYEVNGEKKYFSSVNVDNFEWLDKKEETTSNNQSNEDIPF